MQASVFANFCMIIQILSQVYSLLIVSVLKWFLLNRLSDFEQLLYTREHLDLVNFPNG